MPERIIDILEAVEIEEHQRQRLATTLGAAQIMPDPLGKQAAVGQTGQRVEVRQTLDAGLGFLLLGDVDKGAEVAGNPALQIVHHRHRQAHATAAAVLAYQGHFPLIDFAAAACPGDQRVETGFDPITQGLAQRCGHRRDLVAVVKEDGGHLTDHLVGKVAEDRFSARVEYRDHPIRIGGNDAASRIGEHRRLQGLAFPQRLLRLPAFGEQGGVFQSDRGARCQTLQETYIGLVETTGFVVDLETTEQITVAADDRHVEQVVRSKRLLNLRDHIGIMLGIVAEIKRSGLHDPARHAVTAWETVVNRNPLGSVAVLAENHLSVAEARRCTCCRGGDFQRGGHELPQHHRDLQLAVDFLTGGRHQRQLLAAPQQRGLRLLALADVPRKNDEARFFAVRSKLACHRQFEPAVSLRQRQLELLAKRATGLLRLAQGRQANGRGSGRQHLRYQPADQAIRGGGQQIGTRGMVVMVATIEPHLEHQIGNGIQGGFELGGALPDETPQGHHPDQQQTAQQRADQKCVAKITRKGGQNQRDPHPFLT